MPWSSLRDEFSTWLGGLADAGFIPEKIGGFDFRMACYAIFVLRDELLNNLKNMALRYGVEARLNVNFSKVECLTG